MSNKIVVIPAYEPDEKLIELVNKLNKEEVDIIAVNDGSNDTYNKIFNKIKDNTIYLEHEVNKGKGAALKTAFKYIKNHYNGKYYIVTVDCDGQHTIEDTLNILDCLEKHDKEFILGKRMRDKKIPLRSKIGNSITRKIFYLITGIDVYDTQTGLRAFSNELIDFYLNIPGNRFEYEMNELLYSVNNNIKIEEIPIKTIYINKNTGSHFNAIKDSYRIYKTIFSYLSGYILSFIVNILLYMLLVNNIGIILSNTIAHLLAGLILYVYTKRININEMKYIEYLFRYILTTLILVLINKQVIIVKVIIDTLYFIIKRIIKGIKYS